jgi:class 3 adenylate cyclase
VIKRPDCLKQLDLEEYRDIVRAYRETCKTAIQRYDGHLAQDLDEGILVFFSYPAAHEDDAPRAVRTGPEIIPAIQEKVPSPLAGEGTLNLSRE